MVLEAQEVDRRYYMWGLVLFMLLLAFFLMAMCADED